MRCNKFHDYMERFGDKVFPAQLQSACEEHLKSCGNCQNAFVDIRKMKSLFTGPLIPPPTDLTANIMRNVRNSMVAVNDQGEKTLIQWWKEAAIPVRMAATIAFLLIIAGSLFVSNDLLQKPGSKNYAGYTEFDAFSETQKGSLEAAYWQLIQLPAALQGGEGEKRR